MYIVLRLLNIRIVLESGYFLDNRAFFENLVTILIYAVIVSYLFHIHAGFISGGARGCFPPPPPPLRILC